MARKMTSQSGKGYFGQMKYCSSVSVRQSRCHVNYNSCDLKLNRYECL